jgi:tetratricopeptide (TPR) repeat protein
MSELHLIACPPNRTLNVVFVHGLGGHWQTTWAHDGLEENYWPRWLAEDMPDIGVWSLDYEAAPTHWQGEAMPLPDRAVNVLERLLLEPRLFEAPIIFICHSLGGLVVKEMLRLAQDRGGNCAQLIERHLGAVFIATPHTGSSYANLIAYFENAARPNTLTQGLRRNDSHLRALKVWHVGWAMRLPTMHLAFYEMQQCGVFAPTAQGWKRPLNALLKEVQKEAFGLIVDESSADPGLDGVQSIPLDADHFATCKPAHKGALIYQRTLSYLRQAIEKPPQISARHMQLTNAEIDAMRRSFEKEFTAREGVAPDWFREIFDGLGLQDLSAVEMRDMAREAIAAYRARAQQKVEPSNLGSDIDEAIAAARAKLQPEGPAAALAALDAKLGVEREKLVDQQRRTLALLREKAAILRIGYDHAATRAALTEIARLEPDDASVWVEIGDLWNRTGNLAEARKAFLWALTAARDAGFQPNIAASYDRIGDVLVAQGDLPGALVEFRAGMAIRKALADADAGNAGWRRDLSVSHNNIGDVLVAQGDLPGALGEFRAGMAIHKALADADPGNAGWRRDLSVSHNKIGDVLVAQGDLPAALGEFRAGMAIARALADADPGHAGWRRDLSVSHERIGDVLVAQGDLPGALVEFRAGMAIRKALADADAGNAGWRRDLSVSHDRIGDVLVAQGDLPAALGEFRAGMAIARALADADPGHAGWRRDLSVSHNKIGDVLVAQGDLPGALVEFRAGMAIRKALADADAGNAGWRRDLSVSHDRIGDVLVAQGDLPGALGEFRAGMAIARALADADPGHAGWRRDLSVSHNNIGDVLVKQGDLPGALKEFRAGMAIAKALADADPGHAGWRRDLIASHVRLAGATPDEARAHLGAALGIARDLAVTGRLAPRDAWMVADLETRLAALPPDP